MKNRRLQLVGGTAAARSGATAGGKVLTLERLAALRESARSEGMRVVQCHGCFDIVHPGHIRHLRHAKSHGDILLVSISADEGVAKGTGRPLIPEELRAENLAALDFVDWVLIDHHPTAAELIERVRPDVFVKGSEYERNDDPRFVAEREAVERSGGRVVFTSGDVVFSSSALIAALERSADPYHARLVALLDRPALSGERLTQLVSKFRGKRVAVLGEVITDTYVLCDRPSVAGESPVMTLRPLERRSYDGGAAVIARHAAAMGALPVVVTALPPGEQTAMLRKRLAADGIELRTIEAGRTIPEKQRFLVGAQKVMKLDLVEPLSLDTAQQDALLALAAESSAGFDAAIVADFGLGLFSPQLVPRVCKTLRERVRVLAGDTSGRRASVARFKAMDLVCPSETELRDALHMHDDGLGTAVWKLLSETGSGAAIVTMGADGLVAFDRLAAPADRGEGWAARVRGEHVPALCAHAVDALGCGDALLAAATLALAAADDHRSPDALLAGAMLGSIAAAAESQRLGNIPVSATDLRLGVVRVHASHMTLQTADGSRGRLTATLRSDLHPAAGGLAS